MTNQNDNRYEKQLKDTLSWLSSVAPWMNLIVPIGLVLMVGYFHFYHVRDIINSEITNGAGGVVGAIVWILIASIRITLLFATVYDFRQKDYTEGTLGFLASIGVLIFDLWFIGQICQTQFPNHAASLSTLLRFLSILAVVLEARLVLMMWDSNARKRSFRSSSESQSNGQAKPIARPYNAPNLFNQP